jgi:hypothetical protein
MFEGKMDTRPERVSSGVVSELAYFGKGVSRTKTVVAPGTPTVNLYTSGEVFEGILPADVSVERLANPTTGVRNAAPYGAYLANSVAPIVRKGRVWVVSSDTVDDLSKSVFIRSAALAGTAATVTDTTTYPVADQDTKTEVVTVTDGGLGSSVGAQTVTFSGTHTTALQIAASLNAQLVACSASVVGGQVKLTTDVTGAGVTIAIGTGTTALTWGTPVAGTGADVTDPAASAKGSFRATTTTGYTDLGAIAPVKWLAGQTVGGIYYGLIEINMP